jgi:hypothetical protein
MELIGQMLHARRYYARLWGLVTEAVRHFIATGSDLRFVE